MIPRDSAPLRSGRTHRVRLLRLPLPLLLGIPAAPGGHTQRPARGVALTGAKAEERTVLLDILSDPQLAGHRPGQTLIADKNYHGAEFEAALAATDVHLLRPARKSEPDRCDARFFKPLRQTVESIYDTLRGQLDLERHGGRTLNGVVVRVRQRLLALTAAIWHDAVGAPIRRSLIAYDQ